MISKKNLTNFSWCVYILFIHIWEDKKALHFVNKKKTYTINKKYLIMNKGIKKTSFRDDK